MDFEDGRRGPCRSAGIRKVARLWAAFAALALGACAAEKVTLTEAAPPEVVVETLPSGATVAAPGGAAGTTPYALHAPRRDASYELTVEHPGFLPQTLALKGEDVHANPGARLLVPLRPDLWNAAAPPIDPEDAKTLTRAGVDLSKADRCPEALLFLKRAAEVNPKLAAAHKAIGRCYARLKNRQKALAAYKQYLLVAPDAPDADEVRALVSKAAGDIEIPVPPRFE